MIHESVIHTRRQALTAATSKYFSPLTRAKSSPSSLLTAPRSCCLRSLCTRYQALTNYSQTLCEHASFDLHGSLQPLAPNPLSSLRVKGDVPLVLTLLATRHPPKGPPVVGRAARTPAAGWHHHHQDRVSEESSLVMSGESREGMPAIKDWTHLAPEDEGDWSTARPPLCIPPASDQTTAWEVRLARCSYVPWPVKGHGGSLTLEPAGAGLERLAVRHVIHHHHIRGILPLPTARSSACSFRALVQSERS